MPKVNARGDELGPGGKIIKKEKKFLLTTTETIPTKVPKKQSRWRRLLLNIHMTTVLTQHADGDKPHTHEETAKDDWVEDADGNFVKKDSE